jgi:hypothetical protein
MFAKDISASDIRAFARAVMEGYESDRKGIDFTVETDEGEYRFIEEDAIERIHRESIEQLVDDCYDLEKMKKDMGNLANYFNFDYDGFAEDCKNSDGYGHHFAGYDGNEYENGKFYMFRVN